MLDTAVLFGAVLARFSDLDLSTVDIYFAMARGRDGVPALELTKWFDTNYHYLVPELGPDTEFRLAGDKPLSELAEAAELGVATRPVLIGPLTFLLLAKAAPGAPRGFTPLDLLEPLVERYVELLAKLAEAGAEWVQLDEPAYVADRTDAELVALGAVYSRLAALTNRPKLLVAGYFGGFGAALPVLADTAIEGIAVDAVYGEDVAELPAVSGLRDKTLVLGVVDGRNVWRTDLTAALELCRSVRDSVGRLTVGTSCSLLHVPHDLDAS